MIMVVSTLWKLYDMVITARMKVCARVDPSMSTASKGVDARHNLHVAVDIVALRASRDESQLQCVKDLERGFPTCERNDVALSQRASGVSAHGRRRHGAPTFFIIGGSSPEHERHPSSGIEWCSFGGVRPVS